MQGCDLSAIVSGHRIGPLIVLTCHDGSRLALRETIVRALASPATGGPCHLILTTGERLAVDADFEAALRWLCGPTRPL